MIYLFDKDEKLIKIVRKSAVKTALQKYSLTTEHYVSDRLTTEMKSLKVDELEKVEYMAIQSIEDPNSFHYFYIAQKLDEGNLTELVGVQSGIEELRKSPVYDKRPQNVLARPAIDDLLAGTNWRARFVSENTPHSTNFYYTSVFDALKKVCEVWDLEMQFFVEMNGNRIGARYIDFKQRIGEAVGKRVVYGHNALQILQEVERTNIYTALIGRGKGEESGDGYGRKITFEDVVWSTAKGKPVNKPAGQKYLELPLMTREYGIKNADGTIRPKIGFVDFSEEENPEALIERTYKALVDAARPQLTLKTSSVYLKGVKVGDTIRVVRHDKKLDYDTRIFEITFNRLNNQSSDIKLGDRVGESNEAKAQTIADRAIDNFVANEFSNFVQNLPDYLPSAEGFNNNWYGAENPTVKYPGKVLINDIWYKPDPEHEGHKIMLRWTGEVWEEILRTYDSEALRDRIAEEIAQVNQSMQAQSDEHDRQVADILSNAQSIETLANQAKTDAANAITTALQSKDEAIANATAQVTKVETKVNKLINEVSSKVSQTDYNTLTGRVNSAETAITQNATEISKRLTSTQVEQAITSKGYATVTVLENKVKETADSFSRTISETKALIPTFVGGRNLIPNTNSLDGYVYKTSDKYMNFNIARTTKGATGYSDTFSAKTIDIAEGDTYTVSFFARTSVASSIMCYWHSPNTTSRAISSTGQVSSGIDGGVSVTTSTEWKRYWVTWNQSTTTAVKSLIVGRNHVSSEGTIVEIAGVKLEKGTVATDWSPAPEDLATVTALHNVTDTVDSHTRTIGAVGTTGSILDNVSKVTQTANGLVTEVSGANGLKTQVSTLAGSYAIKNLTNSGTVLNQLNLNKDGSVRIDGKLVQITGTTYIQDGVISSAKIGSLDAGKITTGTLNAANVNIINMNAKSITTGTLSANLISGGVLKSTNGATNFDLNNGNLLFNNNYGYIRRTANDKIFEITTRLTEESNYSREILSSDFMVRKSDFSRQSGVNFKLYTAIDGKPTATTQIYSDSFTITSSDGTTLFSLGSKKSYLGTLNFQGWGDIPVAVMSGGLVVNDIGIGGHLESLLKVVERLCSKTGLIWA